MAASCLAEANQDPWSELLHYLQTLFGPAEPGTCNLGSEGPVDEVARYRMSGVSVVGLFSVDIGH